MTTEEDPIEKLEACTRDALRLQIETLRAILSLNSSVDYLTRHSLDGRTDPASFRRCIPISSYSDYADLIGRIADGDRSPLLSTDPIVCFFYSSGTGSFQPKMIPYFDSKQSRDASNFVHQASSAMVKKLFPAETTNNKILWFLYGGNVVETTGGIKVMAASAYPLRNPGSNSRNAGLFSVCISPRAVFLGTDNQQQMYCHLLCGLRQYDLIDAIRAPYASGLIAPFRMLESRWRQLCDDIECGFVGENVTDVAIKKAMREFLDGPHPDIAKRIRMICEGSGWSGILGKLWPNLRYVSCIITGNMEQYYATLKHYAGDVPILGGDYFSSECPVAINVDRMQPPELSTFILVPTAAYFEFLPFNSDSADDIKDFSNVDVGKMYELVVTTYRGLYRYRLGDVVRVVGFHNSCPQVEYVMRAPKSPSDVVTERDLLSAIRSIRSIIKDEAGVEIIEFTSFLNTESSPKHMVVLVEVSEGNIFSPDDKMKNFVSTIRKCSSVLDDSLGSIHKMQRINGNIGSVEVAVVKPGSFDHVLEIALDKGAIASQYKPPTILRNHEIVEFLTSCVLVSSIC